MPLYFADMPSGAIQATTAPALRDRAVRGSGAHSARELFGTGPGDYDPRSFVTHFTDDRGRLVVVLPYVPIGWGRAMTASYQYADRYARRIDDSYRLVSDAAAVADMTTSTGAEFGLGARFRRYS